MQKMCHVKGKPKYKLDDKWQLIVYPNVQDQAAVLQVWSMDQQHQIQLQPGEIQISRLTNSEALVDIEYDFDKKYQFLKKKEESK